MTLSVVLTINERATEVLEPVLDSLKGQDAEQLVIVFDRTPEDLETWVRERSLLLLRQDYQAVTWRKVPGTPGWRCPSKAWNAGFDKVDNEIAYVISSEVIQEPQNCAQAKKIMAAEPCVLFGKCVESHPGKYGGSIADGLLCSSARPRPLGFIAAFPTAKIREIGGYDEEFMKGLWYEDDDFFVRMWHSGLPFVFDDSVAGVHQSHRRAYLESGWAREAIQTNLRYMLAKHGHEHPMEFLKKTVVQEAGRTEWRHV